MRNLLVFTLLAFTIGSAGIYGVPGFFRSPMRLGISSLIGSTDIEIGDSSTLIRNVGVNGDLDLENTGSGNIRLQLNGANKVVVGSTTVNFNNLDITNAVVSTGSKIAVADHVNLELNADSLASGNRFTWVDFHSQNSVDFDTRILRNAGANGSLVIDQKGSGLTEFWNNGTQEMTLSQTTLDVKFNRIANVTSPSSPQDAANKAYVDDKRLYIARLGIDGTILQTSGKGSPFISCTNAHPTVCTFVINSFSDAWQCVISTMHNSLGGNHCEVQAKSNTTISFICFNASNLQVTTGVNKSVFCNIN